MYFENKLETKRSGYLYQRNDASDIYAKIHSHFETLELKTKDFLVISVKCINVNIYCGLNIIA